MTTSAARSRRSSSLGVELEQGDLGGGRVDSGNTKHCAGSELFNHSPDLAEPSVHSILCTRPGRTPPYIPTSAAPTIVPIQRPILLPAQNQGETDSLVAVDLLCDTSTATPGRIL